MQALLATSACLSRWVLHAARLCLAALGIVVIYGVVLRYAFNNSPPYVEQLALLLVISVAMFGAAAGVHESGHIGLDSLVKLLPAAGQKAVAALVELLIIAFAVLLLYGSIRMGLSTFHDTIPTLGISEAWRYAPPVLASLLIGFFAIVHLITPSESH